VREFEITATIRNNLLKERRGGMTQAQFAAALGVSLGDYCALEAMSMSPLKTCLIAVIKARLCIACGEQAVRPMPMHRYLCAAHFAANPSVDEVRAWMQDQPQEWRKCALTIASALGVQPDELWPDAVLAIKSRRSTIKVSGDEMRSLGMSSRDVARSLIGEVSSPVDAVIRGELERELEREVTAALDALTPREAEVIRMRFGFDGACRADRPEGEGHTLESTSAYLSVSRERVRQIEAKALRKLRPKLRPFAEGK
jgi:RNA polymerase sigma factor (sigma-70 family)